MKQEEFSKNGQIRKVVSYGASAAISLATLPIGTDVKINVTVDEVFDASSTIKIGTNITDNKFINAFSLAAVAGKTSEIRFTTTDAEREITALVNQNTTQGACTIKVDYVLPTSQEVNY